MGGATTMSTWDERAPRTVAFHTLGCKLNQYETEVMRERFEEAGYRTVPFSERADVYVVNSCTVTAASDRDSRRLARQAKRRNPQATVAVVGCYAQTDADILGAIEEIDIVLGNREKADIVAYVQNRGCTGKLIAVSDISDENAFCDESVSRFGRHTRAFVKIQDGCNLRCSYCKVRFARGPSQSRPVDSVIRQVRRLVDAGHREIVLVGVHLSSYGRDLAEKPDLPGLVRRILTDVPDLQRIRLSSLHPGDVSEGLIRLVAESGRVCRHFHLPLQSGDDDILRAMRRPYKARDIRDVVRRIAEHIPEAGIGADVMVGFPGETAERFARTIALIQELPLTYLHVFSFSARPKTDAAQMAEQIPPEEKKRRMWAMRALGREKARMFRESLIGTVQQVLIERHRSGASARMSGLTDNYVRVFVEGEASVGHVIPVAIADVAGDALVGNPV